MAIVARQPPGTRLRAKDLTESTRVPAAYLSKVLRRLTRAGLLLSKKGHHGGFRLARPPQDILLADVLEAVDTQPDADTCVFGWGACNPDDPCPLHPLWNSLSGAVVHWTESATLAEVEGVAVGIDTPRAALRAERAEQL